LQEKVNGFVMSTFVDAAMAESASQIVGQISECLGPIMTIDTIYTVTVILAQSSGHAPRPSLLNVNS